MTLLTVMPLSLGELGRTLDAIGGFEAAPLVAIAVSGGPDSMALTLLADRWARERGGQVWGVTVDHRLRPESADEASIVGGWLAQRGIPHATLVWRGEKPKAGIQEAAREARYRLLAGWCGERGIPHLLTAHHRDDQIETYLMRRRAGSGPDGLAGMSALRELPGCRLVRPLLNVPKARLAAFLAAEGQSFLRDPSNRNPAFERARLRLSTEPVASDTIVAEMHAFARQRIERERLQSELIASSVVMHPAGFASIDPTMLVAATDDVVERVLGRVAACVGGARYPARQARLARLRVGLCEQPGTARTFGGCHLVWWRGRVLVQRELAAASAPLQLGPGTRLSWDRRFEVVTSPQAPPGFTLGYLARQAGTVGPEPGNPAPGDLPRLLYPVLPALWNAEGRLAAVPHLNFWHDEAARAVRVSFQPANPLARASFTVV